MVKNGQKLEDGARTAPRFLVMLYLFAKWVYLLAYILLYLPSKYIIVVFPDPDKGALLPTAAAIQIAFIMFHIMNFINLYQNTLKSHFDCFTRRF